MPARPFPFLAAALWVMTLAAGCGVGPDFQRPEAPVLDGYTSRPLTVTASVDDMPGGRQQQFIKGMDIPWQWWTLFKSPALNALIEKALQANPTVVSARAALRQAREYVQAQKGNYFPQAQFSAQGSRQNNPTGTISPTLTSGAPEFNLYTGQVSVSFAPDVFGANRRQVESLEAQADFQRFQLEATYLTLTSNVVAAAVQEASLRAQIAATSQVIDIQSQILEQTRQRLAVGYAPGLDVAAQEAALAQAQQALPPLQKQLAQTRNQLAALTGRFPSDEPQERLDFAALQLPLALPLSLPSKLVEQRPDVRAAQEQLHWASAQVGVAIANQLPQITLSGNLGGTSTQISQMFVPGNTFWALTGGLAQPIFDAGTLLHKKRAAEAGLEQAAAQYRGTVLTAFQNVADTLHALQSDAEALKAAVAAERAAKRSLDLTRQQLELGYVNHLALLAAEQAYQQALISTTQAQGNRLADTAALFQALGGGWWNRGEAEAAQAGGSSGQDH